ncbi:GDYXXLXY domain-containing protein [Alcaligenaceae bacterium]|nr:GDYXXLXY domain-containing protein [Alcaligenaceae bacterium]
MQVEGDKSAFPAKANWPVFLQKTAFALGCLLLGAAGISWIAANWEYATAFQKLAGVQVLLVALVLAACWLAAGRRNTGSLPSVLALDLAAVVAGGLLALVGQIYQTGADPWQLFFLWMALLIPWLLARPGLFLGLLCACLANVAAALYLGVFGLGMFGAIFGDTPAGGGLLLAGLNILLLAAWESSAGRLGDRWRIGPRALLAATGSWLIAAQFAALDARFGPWHVMALGWLLAGVAYFVYARRRPDLAMVALAGLTAFTLFAVALLSSIETDVTLLGIVLALTMVAGWGIRRLLHLWRAGRPLNDAASGKAPAGPDEPLPWFISLFRLVTMAFTAALLMVYVFITLNITVEAAWIAGLAVSVIGIALLRSRPGGLAHEAGLVLGAAGIFMSVGGLFALDDLAAVARSGMILVFGLAMYGLAGNAVLRFLCAFTVLAALLILGWPGGDAFLGLLDGGRPITAFMPAYSRLWWLAMAAVLAWAIGQRPRRRGLVPLAWALTCLVQLLAWGAPAPAVFGLSLAWGQAPEIALLWVACAALPVCVLAAVLWRAPGLPPAFRPAAPAVLAIASIGWMGAPGVSMALLWLVLARSFGSRSLLAFAVLSLLAYLSRFYYMLDSTLLQKSLVLALTGGWLVLACLVLRHAQKPAGRPGGRAVGGSGLPMARTVAGLLAGLLLILAVVNVGIWQRERILATGRTVVLALAPVDPRSLMQGDYMALRFELANQIREALRDDSTPVASAINEQRGGFMVLRPDSNGVWRLAGLRANRSDEGGDGAAQDSALLEFRLRNNDVRIVTDAWFFPEGHARLYEPARYGEIRVGDKGTGLLRRMLDQDLQPLGSDPVRGLTPS